MNSEWQKISQWAVHVICRNDIIMRWLKTVLRACKCLPYLIVVFNTIYQFVYLRTWLQQKQPYGLTLFKKCLHNKFPRLICTWYKLFFIYNLVRPKSYLSTQATSRKPSASLQAIEPKSNHEKNVVISSNSS